jgi:IclR family transcriptional regulator, acetate operon repressor
LRKAKAGQRSSAAARCLEVLRILSCAEEDLSLQQVAESARLHASTVHRLLLPLLDLGFVEQQHDSRYRVGLEAIAVGSGFLRRSPIRRAALPFMMRLSEQTRLTVNLGFWWKGKVVIVDCLPMPGTNAFYEPGNVVPAHATAIGKALLAHRGKSALGTVGPLDRFTEHTICTAEELEAEMEQVRRLGFAADNEEAILGCRCLAAPILQEGLEPEAAVSLTGPAAMVDDQALKQLAATLTDRCANISTQMNSRFRSAVGVSPSR